MNLLTLGGQALEAVTRRLPAGGQGSPKTQADVYLTRSESRTQEWSEGQPENLAINQSQGIGLRVIQDGKLGFGSTNKTDRDAFAGLADTAVAAASVTAPDPFLSLPKAEGASPEKGLE